MATSSQPELKAAPAPEGAARETPRRGLRVVLVLVGLAVFVLLFRAVGWPTVAANLARIGGWFAALVALYTIAQAAFAIGWLAVIEPGPRRPGFGKLFAVYLAGDSFNYLAPGGVAGEPLKAQMLRPISGGRAAVASLTIHKHADLAAQWVFVAIGVGIALWRFPMPFAARLLALAGVLGLGGLLLLMSWMIWRGSYSPLLTRLARWKFLARRLERFQG